MTILSSCQKFLRHHLLPLAAYTALAPAVLYPVFLHPARLIPGGGDAPRHAWGLWWFEHALVGLGRSPLVTDLIYHPLTDVEVLWESPYNEVLMLPGLFALPPLLHYNLLVLATYTLTGYFTYLLLTLLTRNRAVAFAGGLLFAFSSYRAVRALGHLSLLTTQWIPFLFLAGLLLWRRPSARAGLLLGIAVALVTASSPYYAGMVIGPALLVGAPAVLLLGRKGLRLLRRAALWRGLAVAAAVGAAGSLLTLAPFLRMDAETAAVYRSVGGEETVETFSADLLSWVLPPAAHPLWGRWTKPLYDGFTTANVVETTLFPGFLVLLLALSSFFLVRRLPRSTLYWQGVALLALALSFGPALHLRGQTILDWMPYRWLMLLPGAYTLRVPSRFGVTALLALIVLAAMVADLGLRRVRRPRAAAALLAGGTALVAFNSLYAFPFPATDLTPPGYVGQVRDAPGQGALLSLPAGEFSLPDRSFAYFGDIARAMYYQTAHGKPLVSGYLGRRPVRLFVPERTLPFVRRFFSQNPAQPVIDFPPLDALPPGLWPDDVQAGAALLRAAGIEHAALDCKSYGAALCRRASVLLTEALGLPQVAAQPQGVAYYWPVGAGDAGAVPAALQRAAVAGAQNVGPPVALDFAHLRALALPATITFTTPLAGVWRIQGELHNGAAALALDGAPVTPQTLAAPGASGVQLFGFAAPLDAGEHSLTLSGPAPGAPPAGAECPGLCLGNFGVALQQPQVDAQAAPRVTYVNAAGESFALLDAALYAVRDEGTGETAQVWLATWWTGSDAAFATRAAEARPTLAVDVTDAQGQVIAQAFHRLGERAGWAAARAAGGAAFVDFVEVSPSALAGMGDVGLRLALWQPDDGGGFFWSADPAQADGFQVHTVAPGELARRDAVLAPALSGVGREPVRLARPGDPRRFDLIGVQVRPAPSAPGRGALQLITTWDVAAYDTGQPLVLYVHLTDAAGNILAQADHALGANGATVLDGRRLIDAAALPPEASAHPEWELRIGIWDPARREHFPPESGAPVDDWGRLPLGALADLAAP